MPGTYGACGGLASEGEELVAWEWRLQRLQGSGAEVVTANLHSSIIQPLAHIHIVLSRYDAEILRKEVVRQKSSAKTLKEKMLAEMLEEMVSVIEADSQRNAFVFARKL